MALRGPLGAGKTTFVRAVVRALHGSDDAVSSPTFVFRQRYDGTPPIEHVDLYRIEDPAAELPDLALDDAFAAGPHRARRMAGARRRPAPAGPDRGGDRGRGRRPAHGARDAPGRARPVKILALDAALDGFSAALDDGARLYVAPGGRQDALERGLARIEDLLGEAGLRLRDLDRIAVGLGPGSFTGVRIAVAYAKSLAYGSGVPLVGISSYDALEPDAAPLPLLAVVQGRRGVICARRRDAGRLRRGVRRGRRRARPPPPRPAGLGARDREYGGRALGDRRTRLDRASAPAPGRRPRRRDRPARPPPGTEPDAARARSGLRRSPRSNAPEVIVKAELFPADAGAPKALVIEPMTQGDLTAVLRIEDLSFTTSWPSNAFATEIRENKLAHYFTGRLDGKVVAYGGIWVILEDSHITTIAVQPERRGLKLGEEMLIKLLDEAIAQGASWITLEVRESNEVAQKLYRKYGFTTVSTRRGYYSDNGENALVMWAGNLKGELYGARLRVLRAALDAQIASR